MTVASRPYTKFMSHVIIRGRLESECRLKSLVYQFLDFRLMYVHTGRLMLIAAYIKLAYCRLVEILAGALNIGRYGYAEVKRLINELGQMIELSGR